MLVYDSPRCVQNERVSNSMRCIITASLLSLRDCILMEEEAFYALNNAV
jgi:hypothetical protein